MKLHEILTEQYLGMIDVNREDIGEYARKKIALALKRSLESDIESNRMTDITFSTLSKIVFEKAKNDEDFLIVVNGFKKNKETKEKTKVVFLLTKAFAVAKRLDPELIDAGGDFMYVIDELSKEYAHVAKEIVSLSNITNLMKSKINVLSNAYDLVLREVGTLEIPKSGKKKEKVKDTKED